ncbi:hypothetical protein KY346_06445 [Candidatus Woesearchaeota archaeon]|nr:hypothetical protein [Candidatus Woesearchaeota archaeon]
MGEDTYVAVGLIAHTDRDPTPVGFKTWAAYVDMLMNGNQVQDGEYFGLAPKYATVAIHVPLKEPVKESGLERISEQLQEALRTGQDIRIEL